MKNFKKIRREQLKEVQGGIRPGMKKCLDAVTCELRVSWIGIENSLCGSAYPICAPDGFEPPIDEPTLP